MLVGITHWKGVEGNRTRGPSPGHSALSASLDQTQPLLSERPEQEEDQGHWQDYGHRSQEPTPCSSCLAV